MTNVIFESHLHNIHLESNLIFRPVIMVKMYYLIRVQCIKVLHNHLPGYNRRKFRPVSSWALVLPCTASKIKHC